MATTTACWKVDEFPNKEIFSCAPEPKQNHALSGDEEHANHGSRDLKYAWVIVVCAAFNTFCTMGIANSFGVFSTLYINFIYPDVSTASIAWIGTTLTVLMMGGAIATGPLTDRLGLRAVALTGTLICSISLLLASFTNSLWQVVLTQGAMFGIGSACIYSPSISLPAQWHTKNRSLATGVVAAGGGAGGMVFTLITQKLMDSVGYRWALRALALVLLCISGSAGLFYKRGVPVPRGGIDFASVAKDARLIAVGMGGFFVNTSYFVLFYYLPTAALKIGQTKQASNNLVLFMNAGTTAGRILAAYASQFVGPINSCIGSYAICAILILVVMLAVKSMAGYIVLAVIYGMLCSSYVSITPLILTNVFGPQVVTTAAGIANTWCAVGVLVGNTSQGAIYQHFDRPLDSFKAISFWGFTGLVLAALSYAVLKVLGTKDLGKSFWSRL
ncbi:hypothetical protein H4R99_002822 [Coemansia sp. RSA 1722]|nr:hypothetical protein IWW45_003006 [Coemansia sp. RSA 485]KAJ2601984.1 hypothetical protein H4R99_002822 [Coemansia sp. RSA 1722]